MVWLLGLDSCPLATSGASRGAPETAREATTDGQRFVEPFADALGSAGVTSACDRLVTTVSVRLGPSARNVQTSNPAPTGASTGPVNRSHAGSAIDDHAIDARLIMPAHAYCGSRKSRRTRFVRRSHAPKTLISARAAFRDARALLLQAARPQHRRRLPLDVSGDIRVGDPEPL